MYRNGQSKKFTNLLCKYCEDNNICIDIDHYKINNYKRATVVVYPVFMILYNVKFHQFISECYYYPNVCYTTLNEGVYNLIKIVSL